jgi:hypothetical protein
MLCTGRFSCACSTILQDQGRERPHLLPVKHHLRCFPECLHELAEALLRDAKGQPANKECCRLHTGVLMGLEGKVLD